MWRSWNQLVLLFDADADALVCRRKTPYSSRPRSEQSLVRWATPQLHDIDALDRMVDPGLKGLYPAKSLSRFADVIALCVQVKSCITYNTLFDSFCLGKTWRIWHCVPKLQCSCLHSSRLCFNFNWVRWILFLLAARAWVPTTHVRSCASASSPGSEGQHEQQANRRWRRTRDSESRWIGWLYFLVAWDIQLGFAKSFACLYTYFSDIVTRYLCLWFRCYETYFRLQSLHCNEISLCIADWIIVLSHQPSANSAMDKGEYRGASIGHWYRFQGFRRREGRADDGGLEWAFNATPVKLLY